MLDVDGLKDDIQTAIEDTIEPAIKQSCMTLFPGSSTIGDELSEQISKEFVEMIADPLASRIADAIDAYIKGMDISGTILTTGSPVAQQAVIVGTGMPVLNGTIPNTLGVS